MDWLLHDTYVHIFQQSIIVELSEFDKHIKEYKASLQLSMNNECEVSLELTMIEDIYSNSGTKSFLNASDNRNTKLSGATPRTE